MSSSLRGANFPEATHLVSMVQARSNANAYCNPCPPAVGCFRMVPPWLNQIGRGPPLNEAFVILLKTLSQANNPGQGTVFLFVNLKGGAVLVLRDLLSIVYRSIAWLGQISAIR